MSSEKEPIPFESIVSQPFPVDDVFWLDPEVLQSVRDRINNTKLPVMHLGAETHTEMPAARRQLEDALIPEGDPLEAELKRSLDIGYMYGELLARQTGKGNYEGVDALPEGYLEDLKGAMAELDPGDKLHSYLMFMGLRSLEYKYAHSDVLAFSLTSSQDHLVTEFTRYNRQNEEFTENDLLRMQTLFYAGALTGGLLHIPQAQLQEREHIQLLRGARNFLEQVTVRLEFESGDDLKAAIEYATSNALDMSIWGIGEEDGYIAVMLSGIQFGPNAISIPLYIPGAFDGPNVQKVPIKDVSMAFIRDKSTADVVRLQAVTDMSELSSDMDLVGLVTDDVCVGTYDRLHPDAQAMLVAAQDYLQDTQLKYVNDFTHSTEAKREINYARRFALIGGAALLANVVKDAALLAAGKSEQIDWTADALAGGVVAATYIALAAGFSRLKRERDENDIIMQRLLDRTGSAR